MAQILNCPADQNHVVLQRSSSDFAHRASSIIKSLNILCYSVVLMWLNLKKTHWFALDKPFINQRKSFKGLIFVYKHLIAVLCLQSIIIDSANCTSEFFFYMFLTFVHIYILIWNKSFLAIVWLAVFRLYMYWCDRVWSELKHPVIDIKRYMSLSRNLQKDISSTS